MDIEALKIMERGREMNEAVGLNIRAEMLSGPVDVSVGMREMR